MGIRRPERVLVGGRARLLAYALISLATVVFSISILPQNAFAASVSSASVSGFSSYPSGYILLNQPIEYSVVPSAKTVTDTYTAYHNVPYTAYHNVPYTAYHNVPYTAYHYNVPYTAYHYNVPYTAYHNVPYTAYHDHVPYTAYHNVWVKSGYESYRNVWIQKRWGWGWPNIGVRYWGCQQVSQNVHFHVSYYRCWTYGSWHNTSHWVYHVPYTAYHNVPYTAYHYHVAYTAHHTVPYTAYHNVPYTAYHDNVPYTAYHTVPYTAHHNVPYTAYHHNVPYTAYHDHVAYIAYHYNVPYTSHAVGRLVGVQPGIQDTTQGQYYNEIYYGSMCATSTTPLISPSSPAFPNYSGQVWKYTTFFESNNICTFNPTFIQGNNIQSWLLANNQARLTFTPEYSFDINGSTQISGGQTFYGPSWSLDSISSSTCSIINQYTYCPGQPRVKTPTG